MADRDGWSDHQEPNVRLRNMVFTAHSPWIVCDGLGTDPAGTNRRFLVVLADCQGSANQSTLPRQPGSCEPDQFGIRAASNALLPLACSRWSGQQLSIHISLQ